MTSPPADPSFVTRAPGALLALAFAVSWGCWLPAALSGSGMDSSWVRWSVYAGTAGPAVAVAVVLRRHATPAQREDFFARMLDFGRVGRGWLAAIVLVYPALTVAGATFDWLVSGALPEVRDAGALADPLRLAAYVLLVFLLGPIVEEPCWRGCALDGLRPRLGWLGASLVVGVAWAAWHLPLFFVQGTYQHGIGTGGAAFWSYAATALAASVLMARVFDATGRSILSAILVHAMLNFTRGALQLSMTAEMVRVALLVALASTVAVRARERPPPP